MHNKDEVLESILENEHLIVLKAMINVGKNIEAEKGTKVDSKIFMTEEYKKAVNQECKRIIRKMCVRN